MALILDLADPQELQGFVRGIQEEEERNRFVLEQYLPNNNIDEIEYRVTRGSMRDADAAKVRSWDTESPIGSRQGLERIMGELPPMSKKMRLGEEERLRKRALERGDNQQLVDALYNDAAYLSRGIIARVELFRGEALFNASLNINENGVRQVIPFGRKAEHTVTAATLWSDLANSKPIDDMRTWVQAYVDTNGVAPALGLTSTSVLGNLMMNAQIRSLAGATNTGAPGLVTLDTVNAVFSAFGLPALVAYDANARVDGVQQRVTPANKIAFLPPADEPLGATFFGTTAEALELVEARAIDQDEAPGMVATIHKTDDPVATWTKVAAIALPVLINPDLTFTATVQ